MPETPSSSNRPMRRGQAWVRRHGEEVAVFNPDTDQLIQMNRSAFAIWELCDGETSPEEMAAAVADLTNVDWARAHHDVEQALRDLDGLGLLERHHRPGTSD